MHTRLLTQDELSKLGVITTRPQPIRGYSKLGWRSTSYDAQVGTIVTKRGIHREPTYILKPREIVWVISDEYYSLPSNITGLTTNKTTLTKQGVLALTTGVVDPNYSGPLSTALINFSGANVPIRLGMSFFRTKFFQHESTREPVIIFSYEQYLNDIINRSQNFSDTFLTMDSLSKEIQTKIFGLPRFVLFGTFLAIAIAMWGILLSPITSQFGSPTRAEIEARLQALEAQLLE